MKKLPTVTGDQLRHTVGMFPSGVTVVSTHAQGTDYGMTVSAFASLSLSPALVMVAIESRSHTLAHLAPGDPVAVNVLAEGQVDVAVQFARHIPDRFAGIDVHREGPAGVPVLDGAAAAIVGHVVSWQPVGITPSCRSPSRAVTSTRRQPRCFITGGGWGWMPLLPPRKI